MLTVITPSIPERGDLLAEAMTSVQRQTCRPDRHLVAIDLQNAGQSSVLNGLMPAVESPWVISLDDDDLLYPEHVETIVAAIESDPEVDVVYTQCDYLNGHWHGYDKPFSPEALERLSIVPMTAAFRVELWQRVNGFENAKDFDWRFWKHLSRQGAKFRKIDITTWVYRFQVRPGHVNQSRGDISESYSEEA